MRIFLVFLCIVFSHFAFGQLKGAVPQSEVPEHLKKERKVVVNTPASLAKSNAEKLTKSLGLTEKQHKDLHAALLSYETNIAKTNKSNLSNKAKYEKINEINQKRQNSIKSILTPKQYKEYILSFP